MTETIAFGRACSHWREAPAVSVIMSGPRECVGLLPDLVPPTQRRHVDGD